MLAASRIGIAQETFLDAETLKGFPSDVAAVIDRVAACQHFGGEINGDRSSRDQEVEQTMARFGCDTVDRDASAISVKYKDNKAVQDALRSAADY